MKFQFLAVLFLASCASEFGRKSGFIHREEILGQKVTVTSFGDVRDLNPVEDSKRYGAIVKVDVSAELLNPAGVREEMESASYKLSLKEQDLEKRKILAEVLNLAAEKTILESSQKLCFKVNLHSYQSKDSVEPTYWTYNLRIDEVAVPTILQTTLKPWHHKSIESTTLGGSSYQIGETVYINPGSTHVYDLDNYQSASRLCTKDNVDKNLIKKVDLTFNPIFDLKVKGEALNFTWTVR